MGFGLGLGLGFALARFARAVVDGAGRETDGCDAEGWTGVALTGAVGAGSDAGAGAVRVVVAEPGGSGVGVAVVRGPSAPLDVVVVFVAGAFVLVVD